ncbi:MAG TPA: cadmium-translocating P-type ATPase [Clostridiales bacterium]|nr:cadmium-translocating P-type ATPase [Clostridiales bacterium]
MKQKFNVKGMTCSACSASVEKNIKKLEGAKDVNVNLITNSMTVEYDETILDNNEIIKTVEKVGYGASLYKDADKVDKEKGREQEESDTAKTQENELKYRVIVSFVFLIPLFYIAMGPMVNLPIPSFLTGQENAINFAFTQLLLTLPIVYINRKYYSVGFKTLFRANPNMDSLIALGSGAALVYGIFAIYRIGYGLGHGDMDLVMQYSHDLYFESAGMILALITMGKYLEARSKGRTSEAISKMIDLAPKIATVIRDGNEVEVPVEDVVVDDILVVRPGQNIPVDGLIIEGSASIDQSALTGESIPVEKSIGDKVIAATTNKTGYFKFKATQVGEDTTFAQIIELVEEASSSKAPISKLADKISGIFVPVVIIIAIVATITWLILGYPFEFAMSIGIAVLVISCPCALGLATPVAIMVGTGKGASHGILIKSAEALETLHSVSSVVLDKTGTITEGQPKVTDIIVFNDTSEKEFLRIAASIEKPSEHPLAEAIISKAKEENIDTTEVDSFKAVSGRGIEATIDGIDYKAGNFAYMEENDVDVEEHIKMADKFADEGKTPLFFAENKKLVGVVAVADVVKPTSKTAIKQLKNMGIHVVMLTGDNTRTANAIQKQLDLDHVVADVLPQDKEREIRRLQESGSKVAMIGDGINDAPALVRADVGVAIGAGTDVAIESADIVLMNSNLQDAVIAIELSKATIKNIKQNLFWAFFYNTLGIPLAAGVLYAPFALTLNPMFAAAAMSLSSVFVVTNALRLRSFKASKSK